jgi:uncharacterized protein (TIGR02246 family)
MKAWIITTILVPAFFAMAGEKPIAEPPAVSPEAAAIEKLARSYEASFNQGDAKALGAMFAEDVEYTDEDGVLIQGRPAVENLLKRNFALNPGAKMAISIDSVKLLAPDVVVERGTTQTTFHDGEQITSSYTAIHTRKNGEWRIRQLVESPSPAPTPQERLSELAWMIGAWKEKDGATEVDSKVQWARGGNFLTRTITMKTGGELTLEAWQIIGWDAAQGQIHSWLFDSGGAFVEGVWTRSGNSWLIRQVGALADGGEISLDSTLRRVSDDLCVWESANRTLDGEIQPNLPRIEMARVKEQ